MAAFGCQPSASWEEIAIAADPVLKPLGWSVKDLYEYSTEHPEVQ